MLPSKKNLKSAGWGFVFRDDDGDVIQAARGRLNHVLDVFQAELIVCLQELQRAADLFFLELKSC
jgi:hypothetical protein